MTMHAGQAAAGLTQDLAPERAARTLVVGDVQGCADELGDLLAAVDFRKGVDRLAMLGDMVNRGPKSLETLRLARKLDADVILGNHELYLLGVIGGRPRGADTLDELLAAPDLPDLLDWMLDRPEPLVLLREWVGVHAGFPPDFVLPRDALTANARVRKAWTSGGDLAERARRVRAVKRARYLTTVRTCADDGSIPRNETGVATTAAAPAIAPEFRPWFDYREGGPVIAFGHWARLKPARARRPNLRFLDTGCVYGRALTGWLVEEDRIVSTPARRVYWAVGAD